jgi:dTDP-4-dehydrorhamnose reductase
LRGGDFVYNGRMSCLATLQLPLPLLITGIAGVAGYNAFDYFRAKYGGQVIGIRQRENWPLAGPGIVVCDLEDPAGLRRLFARHQFASVLNAAGNCALRVCELDSRLAWRANVEGLTNLLATIADRDTRVVHLSIDLVFSGASGQGGYVESDPTDPVTVYGKTMVAAEQLILDWVPEACVLRISLPMGKSANGHAGAIDWIGSRFKRGLPATLYFDEIRTPTYCDCLHGVFERLLACDLAGVFHAGGPRRLSLYQIAQVVNRVGGYAPELLMGCPRASAAPIPPRAGNVALDSTLLETVLGGPLFDPWPLDEALWPTHVAWHHERGPERGSPQLLAEVLYRNPRQRVGLDSRGAMKPTKSLRPPTSMHPNPVEGP